MQQLQRTYGCFTPQYLKSKVIKICNMQDGMMNPVETVFNAIDRLGEL